MCNECKYEHSTQVVHLIAFTAEEAEALGRGGRSVFGEGVATSKRLKTESDCHEEETQETRSQTV